MASWGFSKYGFGPKSLHSQFDKFLFGTKPKLKQLPNFTPEMQRLFGEMTGGLQGTYGNALDVLRQYLDPSSDVYKTLSAPYLREFKEQTIPGIAERFVGMGGASNPLSGALSSSGFGQALGAAGAGLQENLASMIAQQQRGAAGDIFGQYQTALGQEPFMYYEKPGTKGFGSEILSALIKALAGGA